MRPQPDFARIRKTLLCGQADRVPIAELKVDAHVMSAFMGRPVKTLQDNVDFWLAAGYDYIRIRPKYDYHTAGAQARTAEYSAYGDHSETRKWAPTHGGVIQTDEDFEKFPWPRPQDIGYSDVEAVARLLPDGMKVISGCTGIYESVWMLMGFEGFSMALAENPALVERMFQKIGELHYNMIKTVAAMPHVGAIWYTDDIAYTEGLLVSPAVYRKHLFPWMRKIKAVCRERDLPLLFHSDGDLWQVMDDLIEIGVNALHPIEPKAMDIAEVKRRVGRKLCLIGNIDLGYTLTRGTPEEVRAEVRERIRACAPGGGYCVGSSNSVTNYVPVANYRAMIEAAREFGKY